MKRKLPLILCAVLAVIGVLYAVFPLFGPSYIPTHDGEYHIIRFIEFYRMLAAGYWFPKWAPTLNSGYGIPIFLFHYPLPNYAGSFFQAIGRNAVDAFKLSLAFGYLAAFGFSFLWLGKLFGTRAGLFGAFIGSFVPYWFVDMYVRGSVGEVWGIVMLFIAMTFLEYGVLLPFSLAVAGLVLSHNILAMLFVPFLLVYALIRKPKFIKGIVWGLGLSAYFWIPALFERQYVVGLNTVDFREHFVALYELLIPSWGTEFSGNIFGGNKISFQIGIIPILIFIASVVVFLRSRPRNVTYLFGFMTLTAVFAIFLMLPFTGFLWEKIGLLQFIQYPWRLLSFLIPCIGFLAAYTAFYTKRGPFLMVIGILAFFFSFRYMQPVLYAPRDTNYYLSRQNFTDGTSSMGNSFSTIWTGWKSARPPYLAEVFNGKITGGVRMNTFLTKTFTIHSEGGADIFLPIVYYPGWEVLVDKKSTPIDYTSDGTIRFSVGGGDHTVVVNFGETPLRNVSDFISLATLVWVIGWGILGVYERRHRHVTPLVRPPRPRHRSLH